MSNSQSDSKGAAPRKRGQKTAAPSPFVDVTEQKRLTRPRGGHSLEEVGPLPERAAVGHGPRGLQPGRQRVGLLQP